MGKIKNTKMAQYVFPCPSYDEFYQNKAKISLTKLTKF